MAGLPARKPKRETHELKMSESLLGIHLLGKGFKKQGAGVFANKHCDVIRVLTRDVGTGTISISTHSSTPGAMRLMLGNIRRFGASRPQQRRKPPRGR